MLLLPYNLAGDITHPLHGGEAAEAPVRHGVALALREHVAPVPPHLVVQLLLP